MLTRGGEPLGACVERGHLVAGSGDAARDRQAHLADADPRDALRLRCHAQAALPCPSISCTSRSPDCESSRLRSSTPLKRSRPPRFFQTPPIITASILARLVCI